MAHKGPTEHRYVTVQVRDWTDHAGQLGRLPPHPHTLLLWLRQGPRTTRVPGLLLEGRAALAEALRWSPKEFDRCFTALEQKGLAVADWDAQVVYLPWVLQQDCARPTSTAVVVGWRKVLADAPACPLVHRVLEDVRRILTPAFLAAFVAGRRVDAGSPGGLAASQTTPLTEGLAAHLPAQPPAPSPAQLAGGLHEQEQEHEQDPPPGGIRTPARSPEHVAPQDPQAAPLAWKALQQEAEDRLNAGRPFLTATGLPPDQERAWLEAWRSARQAYTLDDLRKLGRGLKARAIWGTMPKPITAAQLIERLAELLGEAVAWDEAAPVRPPPARGGPPVHPQAASADTMAQIRHILRNGTGPRSEVPREEPGP